MKLQRKKPERALLTRNHNLVPPPIPCGGQLPDAFRMLTGNIGGLRPIPGKII